MENNLRPAIATTRFIFFKTNYRTDFNFSIIILLILLLLILLIIVMYFFVKDLIDIFEDIIEMVEDSLEKVDELKTQ